MFKFTSSVTFNDTMQDVDNSTSSTTCVTRQGSVSPLYGYSNNLNSAQANVSCAAGAVASEITVGINVLGTEETTDDCVHLLNFPGTNGTVAAYLLESDDTLVTGVGATDTDQIKNGLTGCQSASDNGVSKIQGIMELGSMVIGPRTGGIEIKYNNSRGMRLNDGGGNTRVYFWDMAFFDFTMTAKTARARGSWR